MREPKDNNKIKWVTVSPCLAIIKVKEKPKVNIKKLSLTARNIKGPKYQNTKILFEKGNTTKEKNKDPTSNQPDRLSSFSEITSSFLRICPCPISKCDILTVRAATSVATGWDDAAAEEGS